MEGGRGVKGGRGMKGGRERDKARGYCDPPPTFFSAVHMILVSVSDSTMTFDPDRSITAA